MSWQGLGGTTKSIGGGLQQIQVRFDMTDRMEVLHECGRPMQIKALYHTLTDDAIGDDDAERLEMRFCIRCKHCHTNWGRWRKLRLVAMRETGAQDGRHVGEHVGRHVRIHDT